MISHYKTCPFHAKKNPLDMMHCICDISYRIEEKVTRAIYVWAPLNLVDVF